MTLRWSSLLCAAIAWPGLAHAEPSVETPAHLTLEQSVTIAQKSATTVLKADNASQAAGAQLLQGYAQFLPTLDTSLSYARNSGKTLYAISGLALVNASGLTAGFTISSSLNLFNGLSDLAALKAAIHRKDSSDLTLQFARRQIALDVTQTYLQVVLDQQLVTIAAHNLQASDARLKLLRGQSEVGQASPADLQREQAQRAADDQSLTNARVRAHDDQLLLIRKLRLDPALDYVLEPPTLEIASNSIVTRSEDELMRMATHDREDLRAAESTWGATQLDISQARAPYLPRLDLNFARTAGGTYLFSQTVNGVDVTPPVQTSLLPQLGNQVDYSVTLLLSWNLFDRLINRTAVERARLTADNARIDFEDTHTQTISDVRQAKGDFRAAQLQTQSALLGVKAAQEAFDTIEGRYRVGASSFIDVLAAQSALVSAQAAQAQAAVSLKYEEKLLLYAVGQL
jgi:outer membrane protein